MGEQEVDLVLEDRRGERYVDIGLAEVAVPFTPTSSSSRSIAIPTSTAGSPPACISRSTRSTRSSARPDYVLILPWNLKDEIVQQMRHVDDWGGKFIVPIPEMAVIDPKELPS